MVQMFPTKEKPQFSVALGYFAEKPPAKDEFENQYAEAVKLDVLENKLAPLRIQYQDAVQHKDIIKAAKCLAELQELMKSAASSGLNQFR